MMMMMMMSKLAHREYVADVTVRNQIMKTYLIVAIKELVFVWCAEL